MTHSSCMTYEHIKNRRHAKLASFVSAAICITAISIGWADAARKDYKAQQKMLAQSELDLAEQAIIDTLEFGRVVVNHRGEILSMNAAMEKWTKWTDYVGQPMSNLVPEDYRAAHEAIFFAAIEKAKKSTKLYKTKIVECQLPTIHDPTKTTAVTIALNIVKPKNDPTKPYVVAYVYRTKNGGKNCS